MGQFNKLLDATYHPPRKWVLNTSLSYDCDELTEEEIDVLKKYPKGTMLLRNFNNIVDQGHVAVIISDDGRALIEQDIIHAFAGDVEYKKSTSKTNHRWPNLIIQAFTLQHIFL